MTAPGKLFVFDTETGGVDVTNDRILTCYAMVQDSNQNIINDWHWTIDPGIEVAKGASDVHGMTTEWIRENGRKDVAEALHEIYGALVSAAREGIPIVAYNARFDISILHYELLRHGFPEGVMPLLEAGAVFYDATIHEKERNRYVKGSGMRTLKNTCLRYGIEFDDDKAHAAEYDVIKTAELSWKLLRKERKLGAPELMPLLVEWKAEQDDSLEAYFTKSGKLNEDGTAIRIDRGWPLITKKGS